ncbi:cyclic nucleotide-binding domain-containing protein [Alphaproteobacteria bacterium GH1-50]|uniref:Cyclic nucleotide-binding domain-containing protein n=1 Tax=Kangsaoukella pontilimi TaxID=2691042 RepID=A0A7C9NFG4_9RHOB|nr:Crp/Fnr family transcriptional regulator [Kangsaoukella pontilimi]MXQ08839.1 cyclic nucleotide-binding domain-containing protein [Kangsaoukella pontilimi]
MFRRFTAPKGKVLFQPGQECPGFLLLSKGTIRVTLTGASGREVVLYRVTPGDVCLQTFSCLVTDQPYGAEGVAETDLDGELVPAEQFRTRMADDGAFRARVMDAVARRFVEYQQLVDDIALTGFDARLAKALLRLADVDGKVHATHTALAAETASGRAYVSRRLAEFARQGMVRQDEDGVALLDRPGLQRIAADAR